eukprot:8954-Heterococcus_DN1.PRE.2
MAAEHNELHAWMHLQCVQSCTDQYNNARAAVWVVLLVLSLLQQGHATPVWGQPHQNGESPAQK